MLEKIFLEILNMSFIGSVVIVVVLMVGLFMKKVKIPNRFSYILWALPLIRLIFPFSFESVMSLIPVNPEPIPTDIGYAAIPVIHTGIQFLDTSVNKLLPIAEEISSINPMQNITHYGMLIWAVIMVGFLSYGLYSYFKVKNQLSNSQWESNNIYHSSNITTAFVLGIIHPQIYLPNSILASERDYILLHEQMHIKRGDHIIRCFSFLVLCMHWFNPLVWLAFYISGKDMEMACDESVIAQLGNDVKRDYSQSLLNVTTNTYRLNVSPLAFGEGNTKGRVKNILNYRKPKFYLIILGSAVLLVATIGLLSNPAESSSISDINSNEYEQPLKDISNSKKSEEVIYYGFSEGDGALELNIDKLKDVEYLYSIGLTDNDIHVIKISSTNYYVIRIIDGFSYASLVENSTEIIGLPIVSIPQEHNYETVPNQDITTSNAQYDNYTILQKTFNATEEKISYIDHILVEHSIECVEINISENPIIKGMDTNWIAYDIVTENDGTYILIVRKEDKDFTALIDNNNRQLTGTLDTGILPETYNLIN